MEEQLISFETAKLFSQKRFKISCEDVFDPNIELHCYRDNGCLDDPYQGGYYPAPTQSLLQKWIREGHNLHISINYHDYNFTVSIINMKNDDCIYDNVFSSYEEALEAGLQEALKLI